MEKIQIGELIAKYEFEPTIRDIFVEGNSDICCINSFLSEVIAQDTIELNKDSSVFPIEVVNIPSQYLEENGLQNNNRGRLIALSKILLETCDNEECFLCIIDRDFDKLRNMDRENNVLLLTDFTCMEMYTFNDYTLKKFLTINYSSFPITTQILMSVFGSILQELFLIRYANEELNYNLEEFDFLKLCILEKDYSVTFNKKEYLKRYLNKNGRNSELVFVEKFIEENRSKLDNDARYQIHGHDYINLFLWYLEKVMKRKEYTDISLWKACFLSVDIRNLSSSKLFSSILSKLKVA